MVTLQADEHIRWSVVRGLRDRGVDVRTAQDAGIVGARDRELLAFCRDRDRVLFTNDDDLLSLAAAGKHAGVIFQTIQFTTPGELLRAVVHLLDVVPPEEFAGSIFYLP